MSKPIQEIIDYMESTSDDLWCFHVARTKSGANCFFRHLFNMGKYESESNLIWIFFEEQYAINYMVYAVNDGNDERYQQPTPKQRVIAYLKDLRDGMTKTTE